MNCYSSIQTIEIRCEPLKFDVGCFKIQCELLKFDANHWNLMWAVVIKCELLKSNPNHWNSMWIVEIWIHFDVIRLVSMFRRCCFGSAHIHTSTSVCAYNNREPTTLDEFLISLFLEFDLALLATGARNLHRMLVRLKSNPISTVHIKSQQCIPNINGSH